MDKKKITIPAEEFPHAEEYMKGEATKLPEWWKLPAALKDAHAKGKRASKTPKKG